jgi:hypothetical protein
MIKDWRHGNLHVLKFERCSLDRPPLPAGYFALYLQRYESGMRPVKITAHEIRLLQQRQTICLFTMMRLYFTAYRSAASIHIYSQKFAAGWRLSPENKDFP